MAGGERPPVSGRPIKPLSRLALFLGRILPRGYWPLVRFAAGRDPALQDLSLPLTQIPGGRIRVDMREGISMNFLRHGCMPGQIGIDALFRRLLAPGDLVFDVGANIGYTMLVFADRVGDGGKVLAFEPSRVFESLARNAEGLANARIVQAALSDHVGEAVFHESPRSELSSLEPIAGAHRFSVPVTTCDVVAAAEGAPDFVKIDVEGHERLVLAGMAGLLGSGRPPIVIFEALEAELRDACVATIGGSGAQGRFFRIRYDGSLEPDLDGAGATDYLFLPDWAAPRLG